MKRILVSTLMSFFLFSCASTKNAQVFLRNDVNTDKSKVIVFPMLLAKSGGMAEANAKFSNPLVDGLLGKNWTEDLGKDNTVSVPKMVFDKIPGGYASMEIFIKSLDVTSSLEQNGLLKNFAEAIQKQFGDGAMALALVFEDEAQYKATGKLHLNMGLFDTKKMTWKWITKNVAEKSVIPVPYAKVLQDLASGSYEALKKQSGGKVR